MTIKQEVKDAVSLGMILLLPLLMAYSMVGETAHEWLGVAMVTLFLLHHAFYFRWYASSSKGKGRSRSILYLIIDILLTVDMLLLAVSGILVSRHIFWFLNISNGAFQARTIHLLASNWGFILMSLHLGFHVSGIARRTTKKAKITKAMVLRRNYSRVAVGILSTYGLYAFFRRGIGSYLLLKNQFPFFDVSEPLFYFLADYLAIMVLFAVIGYFLKNAAFVQRTQRRS